MSRTAILLWIFALMALEVQHLKWIWWEHWDCPSCSAKHKDCKTLSSDAYLKFIEDDFLPGQRLNPKTDGRPDRRPDVRENEKILGNIERDFDFQRKPRAPLVLPLHPA